MSDIVERLRHFCTDWDGSAMDDHTEPMPGLHCIELREAADALERRDAEIERLRAEADKLRTVMVAAAEEIAAHWDAHCDAEGYGPANLQRRLEEGIPSQYGYTAGAFAEIKAENERLRAQVAALSAPAPAPAEPAAVEALAHRIAWRYKKSSDPNHSDTYTFNCATLLQFAAALAAPAAPAGWQPIETAPKESGLYLVRIGNQTHVAQFNLRTVSAQWWAAYGSPSRLAQQPTHWMPLPAAPGAPQGDAS